MSATWDAWQYREDLTDSSAGESVVGYTVHATDGEIGKVDEETGDVGAAGVVVDTGPWIFGRRVLLPAGTVQRVDRDAEELYVDLTKDQVKGSPELPEGIDHTDTAYRERLGGYYGGVYGLPPGTVNPAV
ncbi:PRC-barrel domain-containing protein [Georgenia subflava]|nr:PRC-barrel domain-containing protein [Georgenia subflava]